MWCHHHARVHLDWSAVCSFFFLFPENLTEERMNESQFSRFTKQFWGSFLLFTCSLSVIRPGTRRSNVFTPRVFINYKLCWCRALSVQHLSLRPKNTNNYKTGVFSVKWPLTFKLNTLWSKVLNPLRANRCLMRVQRAGRSYHQAFCCSRFVVVQNTLFPLYYCVSQVFKTEILAKRGFFSLIFTEWVLCVIVFPDRLFHLTREQNVNPPPQPRSSSSGVRADSSGIYN